MVGRYAHTFSHPVSFYASPFSLSFYLLSPSPLSPHTHQASSWERVSGSVNSCKQSVRETVLDFACRVSTFSSSSYSCTRFYIHHIKIILLGFLPWLVWVLLWRCRRLLGRLSSPWQDRLSCHRIPAEFHLQRRRRRGGEEEEEGEGEGKADLYLDVPKKTFKPLLWGGVRGWVGVKGE